MVQLLNWIPSSKLITKCHVFLLTLLYIVRMLWVFSFFCRRPEYTRYSKIAKIKNININGRYAVHDKINIFFLLYIYIYFNIKRLIEFITSLRINCSIIVIIIMYRNNEHCTASRYIISLMQYLNNIKAVITTIMSSLITFD